MTTFRRQVMTMLVVVLGLTGCSTSTTTVIQAASTTSDSSPSPPPSSSSPSQACFDGADIVRLSKEWKKTATELAAMRTTNREIALELALATAVDPVVSEHFKDAADFYANAPAHVGTPADLTKSMDAMAGASKAMKAGASALGESDIPFC